MDSTETYRDGLRVTALPHPGEAGSLQRAKHCLANAVNLCRSPRPMPEAAATEIDTALKILESVKE
jgi:hypothetical protein